LIFKGGHHALSAIVAFSDVHLGYDQADSNGFLEFIKYLQGRRDLGDVVIVGDFIDLWRRDIVGLEFELSRYVEELKTLQKTAKVHYVAGNHDAHVKLLKDHNYPFDPQPSIGIKRFGYTVKFLHGHQCDPLQNILGPNTSEILCWTLSDDIGDKKSWLWEILGSEGKKSRRYAFGHKIKSKKDFRAKIDVLMSPPEDVRRTKALAQKFGTLSNFVDCLKAKSRITGRKEFIVYGHTHQPFIDLEKRVANTGSWIKGGSPSNTYFEFARWPPEVIRFKCSIHCDVSGL
jgi:UDP-2,3-diacylglucosamine pyrophosphatase LpxH